MGESKFITYEEYEDCYREALLILKETFKDVGQPYRVDGQRVCSIKTGLFDQPLALDDQTVFYSASDRASQTKSINGSGAAQSHLCSHLRGLLWRGNAENRIRLHKYELRLLIVNDLRHQ